MSRYIDANKLIERLKHNPNFLTAPKHSKDGIIDEIVYQPTADVVEVVRCRDCKFSRTIGRFRRCEHTNDATPITPIEDMHYCSYGERRENDND